VERLVVGAVEPRENDPAGSESETVDPLLVSVSASSSTIAR
jgi:hypothetical protein